MRTRSRARLVALYAATLLVACSVDAVTFTPLGGPPAEDCTAPGDEDGNGLADCSDPACAGASACQSVCGNGVTETGEDCDDGNAITEVCAYGQSSCAVCDATCHSVPGATSSCGDSSVDANHEQCDDGNASTEACAYGQLSCMVCDATCQSAAGATSYCGDSAVDANHEQCDDGNATTEACAYGQLSCTVCDATCQSVAGTTSYCGDSAVDANHEQCDDGNATTEACAYGQLSCTVCNATCQSVAGATSNCGDGSVDAAHEQCDDGNTITEVCAYGQSSCTVCDATCHAVAGATSNCGDGSVDTAHEQCDDGNTINGDGCDSNCTVSIRLSLQAYLKASNTNAVDQFGQNIALSADGSTLAVGAPFEDSAAVGINGDQTSNAASSAGAVYVFVRNGATWVQQAYLKASNTDANDQFGISLALSADGSTLAVGARTEASAAVGINGDQASNAAANAGAVYVFTRSGTTWSQQAYVKASNTGGADLFGGSVALSADGSIMAVGAFGEDSAATGVNGNQLDNTATDAGAVYVFQRSGTVWSQQAYLKASNPGASDQFGSIVALSGDGLTLAAGALGEDSAATGVGGNQADNAASGAGAVYVFTRSGVVWSQQAYVKASNTAAGDQFGISLALAGDGSTLAVGANLEDSAATGIDGDQADNAAVSAGAVYVFMRSGVTWSQQTYVHASNTGAGDQFGISVALSGDGSTLTVGATLEDSAATGVNGNQSDNTGANSGAVYLFRRSGMTWSQRAYVKASNTGAGDQFGFSMALTFDGSILAVAAPAEDSAAIGVGGNQGDNTAADAGAVYVYR
ncbi:MAG TPA: hypothetical protein VN253_02830 [Kofleriaceae bacterium]|nr:hypothetical protein [Kofleriaceae bacterium]